MTRALPIVVSVLLLGACNGDDDSPFTPSSIGTITLTDIVASVAIGDAQGVTRPAPVPSGNTPVVSVAGNQTVINGGTLTVTVTSATPLQSVVVYVGADALGIESAAAVGIGGFYEVALPAPGTSAAVLLTFPQTIALDAFDLLFAGVDAAGNVGPFVGLPVTVTQVGTGDIQVTLSWDTDADVDLHVVEPGGEETYYANRQSATGGELDLDSNAACNTDGVRNENITWPTGQAPRGVYTVRVDYWSSCGAAATNYTVRINNGGSVQVFTGRFTGEGDNGGAGSGVTIATFERLTGPAPSGLLSSAQPTPVQSKGVSHGNSR